MCERIAGLWMSCWCCGVGAAVVLGAGGRNHKKRKRHKNHNLLVPYVLLVVTSAHAPPIPSPPTNPHPQPPTHPQPHHPQPPQLIHSLPSAAPNPSASPSSFPPSHRIISSRGFPGTSVLPASPGKSGAKRYARKTFLPAAPPRAPNDGR